MMDYMFDKGIMTDPPDEPARPMSEKCKYCGEDLGVLLGIVDHCVVHDYEEWLDIRPHDCYEREIAALKAKLEEQEAENAKFKGFALMYRDHYKDVSPICADAVDRYFSDLGLTLDDPKP